MVTDKEDGTEYEIDNEYIMSAKDLCTIDFLDKIVDASVSVIKIEGRGRSADYVDTVTRCYREALDAIAEGSYNQEKIEDWKKRLSEVYNRGFWDGYYLGRKMGEWSNSYGSVATTKKILLGKGTHYFNKIKVGEFVMEAFDLQLGDEILITGPVTGVIKQQVEEIRVENVPVSKVEKGEKFSIPLKSAIRESDKLYKVVPA